MKKAIIALTILLVAFSVNALAGERDVLRAFETIKAHSGMPDKRYSELLSNVEVEINILKRSPTANKDFLDAANSCLKAYVGASYNWMMADEAGQAAQGTHNYEKVKEAMRPYMESVQKNLDDGAILLDKLYTFVK